MRIIVLVAGQAETGQPAARGFLRLLRIGVEHLKAEQHVLQRGAPRHQPVVLEHDADLAAEVVELAERIMPDDAGLTLARLDQPGDDVEHCRFAAAGLAQHGDDLAFGDLERQSVDGDEIAFAVGAAEGLGDLGKADDRIGGAHIERSETGR